METPDQLNSQSPIPVFKVDPIMVLVFAFITCGLYLIYWNIKMAEVLNAVAEREIISQPVAIFAGCCMPVNVYFYYLAGKEGLPKVYERTGEAQKDQSTLLLVLGFFIPMVAAMIVQGDVNKLYN
jgi:ABC-type Na+ efflux pump permease subunit